MSKFSCARQSYRAVSVKAERERRWIINVPVLGFYLYFARRLLYIILWSYIRTAAASQKYRKNSNSTNSKIALLLTNLEARNTLTCSKYFKSVSQSWYTKIKQRYKYSILVMMMEGNNESLRATHNTRWYSVKELCPVVLSYCLRSNSISIDVHNDIYKLFYIF